MVLPEVLVVSLASSKLVPVAPPTYRCGHFRHGACQCHPETRILEVRSALWDEIEKGRINEAQFHQISFVWISDSDEW